MTAHRQAQQPRGAYSSRGDTIAYTQAGTGPVVLLIHGLGGTRRTWRTLIPALATTFTVIAPDLPGHGDSDPPAGDYSLGAHACAVRDLLVALGHSQASILGHSLGGGCALQFVYQFPDRTDRLMLISSGGLGAEVTPMLRAATLPGAGAMVAGLSKVPVALTQQLFRVLPALTARADARPLAEGLRGLTGGRQRRAFVRTAHTVLDWRGQTVSASRQTGLLRDIPVLLAWGAEDKTIPTRHHHAFAERVPHAVAIEIPAAGHYPHETASTQLLPALTAFLNTTTPFRYSETRWRYLLTHPDISPTDHNRRTPQPARARTRPTPAGDAMSSGNHATSTTAHVGAPATTATAQRAASLPYPVASAAGWNDLDVRAVDTMGLLVADSVQKVGNGHPGTAMSLAPLAYLLFRQVLTHDPSDDQWLGRDRFVLSCGHTSLTRYIQLYLSGYGLELEDLESYRTWGSKTPGHPEYRHTRGVEITTGPLGQGLGSAVGMAMAARRERGLLDPDAAPGVSPFDHHVYFIASDGDLIPTTRSRPANAGEPIAWAVDLPVTTSARRQSRAPFGFAGYLSDLGSQANTS